MKKKSIKKKEITISPNKIKIPQSDGENGIPDEFIQTSDNNCQEIFTCAICVCVAWDPVCCPKCDKIFCRSCRLKYGKNKICPFKCDSYTFREITRNEKNYLNKIFIKCSNIGCSQYICYLNYQSHLEKCIFRKYHCKNEPCKIEGSFNEMMEHSYICKYRRITCQKCGQKVKYCELKIHPSEQCLETLVKCVFCGLKMKRGIYLNEHISKNNTNPDCLKTQMENLSNIIEKKNAEIDELKNRIKELEKKNDQKEIENNNLKKNLKEIKQFITNGYNKFILEEEDNNDKNIGDVLNINDEINKKNHIELPKVQKKIYLNNEIDEKKDSDDLGKKYLNSETNFYPRSKASISNKNMINNYNNYSTERKINRILISNKKELNSIDNEQSIQPINHMRKVPSLNYLPSKKDGFLEYNKREINPFKKLDFKK